MLTKSSEKGAIMPPILANVEHVPRTVLRTLVGNISAVYRYMIPNALVMPHLPTKDAISECTDGNSAGKETQIVKN